MILSDFPVLDFKDLIFRSKSRFYSELAHSLILTNMGRGAVYWAVNSLQLSEDDAVAVPAYHCGVEIEAIRLNRVKLEFYSIEGNLDVDLDDFARVLQKGNVKAAMVIHYYGFPQKMARIREICKSNNVVLLEDCAHSHLTMQGKRRVGSFGQLTVYSFRKLLPLIDGGGYVIQNTPAKAPVSFKEPHPLVTLKGVIGRYARNSSLLFPLLSIYHRLRSRQQAHDGTNTVFVEEVTPEDCQKAMSRMMHNVLRRTDDLHVVRTRRRNYAILNDSLIENQLITKIKPKLETGVVPLCYPLRISDGKRDLFEQRMQEQGVACYIFGKNLHTHLDRKIFKEAERLSDDIICLPVHQKINRRDVVKLAAIVNSVTLD